MKNLAFDVKIGIQSHKLFNYIQKSKFKTENYNILPATENLSNVQKNFKFQTYLHLQVDI